MASLKLWGEIPEPFQHWYIYIHMLRHFVHSFLQVLHDVLTPLTIPFIMHHRIALKIPEKCSVSTSLFKIPSFKVQFSEILFNKSPAILKSHVYVRTQLHCVRLWKKSTSSELKKIKNISLPLYINSWKKGVILMQAEEALCWNILACLWITLKCD